MNWFLNVATLLLLIIGIFFVYSSCYTGEDIEVLTMPIEKVEEMVLSGEIDHSLVLSALYYYRLRGSQGS